MQINVDEKNESTFQLKTPLCTYVVFVAAIIRNPRDFFCRAFHDDS